MVPSAVTNDGVMDVLLVKKLPYYAIPKLLLSFFNGKIENQTKHVTVYRCKKIQCSVDNFNHIEIDGEVHPLLPAEIKVHSNELRIFSEEIV